jgi:hypothetical protein
VPVGKVKVKLAGKCYAYDMLSRKYLGNAQEFEVPMPMDAPALIACLPYEVKEIKSQVDLRGRQLSCRFSIVGGAGASVGTHVVHVEFRDPKDKTVYMHSMNLLAKGGLAAGVTNFAEGDEAGTWTLIVTDVVSGASTTTKVEVR